MDFMCWCGLAADHPPLDYTNEISKDHAGPYYEPKDLVGEKGECRFGWHKSSCKHER